MNQFQKVAILVTTLLIAKTIGMPALLQRQRRGCDYTTIQSWKDSNACVRYLLNCRNMCRNEKAKDSRYTGHVACGYDTKTTRVFWKSITVM